MSFAERVYALVRQIPAGKVATYGQIAALLGQPRAARAVGGALHRNPDAGLTPCHRVVNAAGRLAPGFAFDGPEEQAVRLGAEGVVVVDGLVDLARYGWRPSLPG